MKLKFCAFLFLQRDSDSDAENRAKKSKKKHHHSDGSDDEKGFIYSYSNLGASQFVGFSLFDPYLMRSLMLLRCSFF